MAPSRASGGIDRDSVLAAVERYLAKRGVEQPLPVTAAAVDRFLAARRSPNVAKAPATLPPYPVEISDFVCEDDVRRALAQSRKIFIGPKTIVPPGARPRAQE